MGDQVERDRMSTRKVTGKLLNEKWGVGAKHALYREDGKWYMPLERFPGALFDPFGYVLFETKDQYENCPALHIGMRVNVPEGISSIPSYKVRSSN